MPRFTLLDKMTGYQSKTDPTNTPFNKLISPSQNVLINIKDRVSTRGGTSLLGAANSAINAIEGGVVWQTSSGGEITLRSYDDELEIYTSTLAAWTRLKNSLSAVDLQFDTWWSSTEGIDLLLWVDGTDDMYEWSGGITTLNATTSNTIKKNGTNTWAQDRFLTAGTRKVVIGTIEYTYTGGETTTTLTGVTPDPTGEAADSNVFQAVRVSSNTPASGFLSDSLRVLNNQVWVRSSTSRVVYVSKDSDFTDYTLSTPRLTGEGATLTLDDVPKALVRQDQDMFISAGRDDWYRSRFEQIEVSGVSTAETLLVKKLKTGPEMGAQSQDLVLETGDFVAFIDHNNVLRLLGNVENVESTLLRALSDPVKPDFDAADFTNGHMVWHGNRIYISAPNDDKVFILELRETANGTQRRFWQAPQVLPVRRFAIISGVLYGHSNAVPETYKLFDGTNDNGFSFKATAALAYRNYKNRDRLKNFDEWLTEGYISANTELGLTLNYDFEGSTQQLETTISGADDDILFQVAVGGRLGTERLGVGRIGAGEENVATQNPKFRVFNTFALQDFFEIQAIYETDEKDAQWEIMAAGGNTKFSRYQPVSYKK